MIKSDQCNWENLSQEKKKAVNDAAIQGMIEPNQCTWENLSQENKETANSNARKGYILTTGGTCDAQETEDNDFRTYAQYRCAVAKDKSDPRLVKCPRTHDGKKMYCSSSGYCMTNYQSAKPDYNSTGNMCRAGKNAVYYF